MRQPFQARLPALLILTLGFAMFAAAIALTISSYMPCPFWDEWAFVNAIANGAGATSWHWLWSQHNEHRLLLTRLLILLDLRLFDGRNISLFVEMFAAQLLQLAAICHVLARYTTFPRFLKMTIGGIFAFCLFHLNQAQNFTWAFQASFVIAFAIGTLALLGVAYFEQWRWPTLVSIALGLAPLIAAVNVAGALMIGPVVIVFAGIRGVPLRSVAVTATIFSAGAAAYLFDYRMPPSHLPPSQAMQHPKDLLVYVLTYFGASWTRLLSHKERITCFVSFIALAIVIRKAVQNRKQTTEFEWFCIGECTLMLAIAGVTALGRLQFGVGQAYAGRYQTPAMLYWAALCALVLIAVWRYRPDRFPLLQWGVSLILVAAAATCIPIWHAEAARNNELKHACYVALNGNQDANAAKLLYGATRMDLEPGLSYLKRLWNYSAERERNRE